MSLSNNISSESAPLKRKRGRPRKQLFSGLEFFITTAPCEDESNPTSNGDKNTKKVGVVPNDRIALEQTIISNGGKVLDCVGQESASGENTYLLSHDHVRTLKYIYCIAGGLPCVSIKWIQKSIAANKLLDWETFSLNSGYSLEQCEVIQRHKNKPLKGIKILVTAETNFLRDSWRPVLQAAEAHFLEPTDNNGYSLLHETEILVTDETCPINILTKARDFEDILIVKPEWLVQTIITGAIAGFNTHERYIVGEKKRLQP